MSCSKLEVEYSSLVESMDPMMEDVERMAEDYVQAATVPLLPAILNRKEVWKVRSLILLINGQRKFNGLKKAVKTYKKHKKSLTDEKSDE